MNQILQQSIQKTLAYFDLSNYPLTKEELFRFLWQAPAMAYTDFLAQLAGLALPEKYSYYFLPGNEHVVEQRRERLVISEQKLKKACAAAKKIKSIPFLRAIFVCNSVGFEQAKEESDIDFLIIAEPKRIWIVRFFANLILRFYGLRTYGTRRKDKICLCFFVDSKHLDMSPLRVANDDVYLVYWLQHLVPLYDPDNYYKAILNANAWTRNYIPNASEGFVMNSRYAVRDTRVGRWWKKIWEAMWRGPYGDVVEQQTKEIQWHKLRPEIKDKAAGGDKGIILSDGILKFHENDRRDRYRQRWLEKIESGILNQESSSSFLNS